MGNRQAAAHSSSLTILDSTYHATSEAEAASSSSQGMSKDQSPSSDTINIMDPAGIEIKTANVFYALQTTSKNAAAVPQEPKLVVWTLKRISSWADCEDEDDDEFFSCVAPLSSGLPLIREEKNSEAAEEEEGKDEEDELEDGKADKEELITNPKLPVQKPKAAAAPSKPVLAKKEQRQRKLAEKDSILAELGFSQELVPKQWEKKEEKKQHTGAPSQESSVKIKASAPTQKRWKPKKEKVPLAQATEAFEARGDIDHVALRKMAALASSQKGSKRSSGCAASSSLLCKAAAAEASAKAAKKK